MLRPPEVEAEYRLRYLRDDGRTAATVVGALLLLSLAYIPNDLHWTVRGSVPWDVILARFLYLATAVAVVLAGLRPRSPTLLDLTVVVNAGAASLLTVVLQATRPADYYLPVLQNAIGVLICWAIVPNRFLFQGIAGALVTLSCLYWVAVYRIPPSPQAALLIGLTLLTSNLAGAFLSWTLHRSRRLQFLAIREEAGVSRMLRESEDLFRSAFENVATGKALCDPGGRILRVNAALCTLLGRGEDALVGTMLVDLLHPDDRALASSLAGSDTASQEHARFQARFPLHGGGVAWGEVAATVVRDAEGVPLRCVVEVLDLTEKHWAEEALSASRSRHQELYESLGDGVASISVDGAIQGFNEAFRRMLGYSADELRSLRFPDFTPERWHAAEARVVDEVLRTGATTWIFEKEYRRKDGSVFPVEIRGFVRYRDGRPEQLWGIVRDMTEARALREKLAVTSRLAAMGTLVAGMAHEINNPLGGAMASHHFAEAELVRMAATLRSGDALQGELATRRLDEVLAALQDAQAGEQRVATIVKDLRLLGRPDGERSRVSLSHVAEEALRWVPSALRARASIVADPVGAPEVEASEGQLLQVVANLVSNACHAAPDGARVNVRVRTGTSPEGRAVLEVSDDGVGMTREVLERAFDPFFTTREVGRGTGLGLAICHAIVTAHGGAITVTSEPGKGSTFRVELPAAA